MKLTPKEFRIGNFKDLSDWIQIRRDIIQCYRCYMSTWALVKWLSSCSSTMLLKFGISEFFSIAMETIIIFFFFFGGVGVSGTPNFIEKIPPLCYEI